jgi:hypothetical protein
MVQPKYAPERKCSSCGYRPSRTACGRCKFCRDGGDVPDEQRVREDELAAYYAMKEQVMRDCGLNPLRAKAGEVDDLMRRERIPDLKAFRVLYRRANGGLPVVPGGVGDGGRGRVPDVLGAAGGGVEPGDPGADAGRAGRGDPQQTDTAPRVGADAGDPPPAEGAAAVLDVRADRVAEGDAGAAGAAEGVRLTRYWLGVPAGTRGSDAGRLERGGVPLVRVLVPDQTLFGRTILVPVAYTQVA